MNEFGVLSSGNLKTGTQIDVMTISSMRFAVGWPIRRAAIVIASIANAIHPKLHMPKRCQQSNCLHLHRMMNTGILLHQTTTIIINK